MENTNINAISQQAVDKLESKNQALNGWVAISSAQGATTGRFSGVYVMAGDAATVSLVFDDAKCITNGLTIDLVEGGYLPTPGCTSVTVTTGKVILIKAQL